MQNQKETVSVDLQSWKQRVPFILCQKSQSIADLLKARKLVKPSKEIVKDLILEWLKMVKNGKHQKHQV